MAIGRCFGPNGGDAEKSDVTEDRDSCDLIFRKSNTQKRESYQKIINGEPSVVIGRKKWRFGFLGAHFAQPKGDISPDVREKLAVWIKPPRGAR